MFCTARAADSIASSLILAFSCTVWVCELLFLLDAQSFESAQCRGFHVFSLLMAGITRKPSLVISVRPTLECSKLLIQDWKVKSATFVAVSGRVICLHQLAQPFVNVLLL